MKKKNIFTVMVVSYLLLPLSEKPLFSLGSITLFWIFINFLFTNDGGE